MNLKLLTSELIKGNFPKEFLNIDFWMEINDGSFTTREGKTKCTHIKQLIHP